MLGVGSDAVLAALATVVRKPKRQPTNTKSSGATATQASATPKFPLKTLGPSDTDAPLFNTVVPTVLLKTRKSSAISAPLKVTRMGSPSTKRPPGAASRMVGSDNDEELATPTTTVRKLKSKTGNISIPGAATFPLVSVGPLVADTPMPDTDAIAVGANTRDAESPHPSTTTDDSLLVSPRSEAHSPFADTSLSIAKLGAVSRYSVNTKLKQSAASIDPSSNPIEVPNFVDLTESIASPQAKLNSLKHQEMVKCPRYNINVSRKWEEHDMSKCTVLNTVVEVLPDIRFTDSETSYPTTFNQNRTEVKKRAKGSVVDFWFNGDSRGENELVKYVKDATKTIKIGVDILHHEG
ncbi:hypothetical protein GN244_ATG03965 [Phytophthora infestans]|nr:hypothetical protein GN244_ATG03965 [Phytophthora infestans]